MDDDVGVGGQDGTFTGGGVRRVPHVAGRREPDADHMLPFDVDVEAASGRGKGSSMSVGARAADDGCVTGERHGRVVWELILTDMLWKCESSLLKEMIYGHYSDVGYAQSCRPLIFSYMNTWSLPAPAQLSLINKAGRYLTCKVGDSDWMNRARSKRCM